MRAVVQRVSRGKVTVGGRIVSEIGRGLVILLGVGQGDTEAEADWMARKCAGLRIFEDEGGKMNLSVQEAGGEVLLVSQFTLYADSRKGRRPSFVEAALPDVAEPLVTRFAQTLAGEGVPTRMGEFGAHMAVEISNDGPVTIILERERPRQTGLGPESPDESE